MRFRAAISALAALAVLAALSATSSLGEGLDRGFGNNGRVVAPLDLPGPIWFANTVRAAAGTDGDVLVADSDLLLRYRSDGSLDPAFGADGAAAVPAPAEAEFTPAAVLLQADGSIVLAGTAHYGEESGPGPIYDPATGAIAASPAVHPPSAEAMLVRYGPTGNLDAGFGNGGVLLGTFGASPPTDATGRKHPSSLLVSDAAVDSQGRVVLAGSYATGLDACRSFPSWRETAYLARLLPNGEPDRTFGDDGLAAGSGLASTTGLAIGSGDRPFVVGQADRSCGVGFGLLVAYRADGEIEPRFADHGRARVNGGHLAIDRRGRPLVLASPQLPHRSENGKGRYLHPHRSLTEVLRLSAHGKRDRSFGRRGVVKILLPGPRSRLSSIALAPDGSIFFGGTLITGTVQTGTSHSAFAAFGLNPDGRRIASFGNRGLIATRFGAASDSGAQQAVFASGGRLVLAGALGNPSLPTGEGLALSRYPIGR